MSDVVFVADFTSDRQWVAGRSWAYPDGGPTNPNDNKLDHLTQDPAYFDNGTFRATRRSDGLWDTGLLTTEESAESFYKRQGRRSGPGGTAATRSTSSSTTRTTQTYWNSPTTSATEAVTSATARSAPEARSLCT